MIERTLIRESVRALLGDGESALSEAGKVGLDQRKWDRLVDSGFTAMEPEQMSYVDDALIEVTREIGFTASRVPYLEIVGLGRWVTGHAGWQSGLAREVLLLDVGAWDPASEGRPSFHLSTQSGIWRIDGRSSGVAWARSATHFVFLDEQRQLVARLPASECAVLPGSNLAGEPRDEVIAPGVPVEVRHIADSRLGWEAVRLRGAGLAAVAMAGAMERVLVRTCTYAAERSQFGRTLSAIGAVQQSIALLASEVAAVVSGVRVMAGDFGRVSTDQLGFAVMSAKARASAAAETVCSISHQVHGAIGIAQEYGLADFTRRLLAWRDEYGSERYWYTQLGRVAAGVPSSELWAGVVSHGRAWGHHNSGKQ